MTTTSIKFYYNGLKLNGSRELIKCFYGLDNNREHSPSVSIYAKGYGADSNCYYVLFRIFDRINETRKIP